MSAGQTLPPGQRRIEGFPRFGTHLHRPPPSVPRDPVFDVAGAVTERFAIAVSDLAVLPRRVLTADFHCVAGWSATDLDWEGVPFETLYRLRIEPHLLSDVSVTHVLFVGLDEFRSMMSIEDALADDVLIADQLNGRPLDGDHGAPARLVSPSHYGYVNAKHLCRIELHTREPRLDYPGAPLFVRIGLQLPPIAPHPRARVWEEERTPHVPGWLVRPLNRLLIAPIRLLSARGSGTARGNDG